MIDVRTLTREQFNEYVTKGMLLGMKYDWRFHTFYPPHTAVQHDEIELDADTLEELNSEVRFARMIKDSLVYGADWDGLQRMIRDEEQDIKHVPIPDPR